MISNYEILGGTTLSEINRRVNQYIEEGWQPHGDFKVLVDFNDNWLFYQTVVRSPLCDVPEIPVCHYCGAKA